jgi:hypothetical protein
MIAISEIGPTGAKELGGQQDLIEPATPFSPMKLCRKGRSKSIGRRPEKPIGKSLLEVRSINL